MRATITALVGLTLLLVVSQARAEYRSVLIQVTRGKDKKVSVTIHSDDKRDRRAGVTVGEAVKAIGDMRGWGSSVGLYVTSESGIPAEDLRRLRAAVDGNFLLRVQYFGRKVPQGVGAHFLKEKAK